MSRRNFRRRTKEEWRQLVKRLRESDLRQVEFCAQVGVSSTTMSYYVAEFAKEDAAAATLRSTDSEV